MSERLRDIKDRSIGRERQKERERERERERETETDRDRQTEIERERYRIQSSLKALFCARNIKFTLSIIFLCWVSSFIIATALK